MDATEINNSDREVIYGLLAGNTVKVGDVVCVTDDEEVTITTTAASHAKRIGVVIGGERTYMQVVRPDDLNAVGQTAATAGERVIVCTRGIVYVVTGAAIAVGAPIIPSVTTAGRVEAAAAYTVAAGAVAVTSSAANGAIISGEGLGKVFGRLLQVAAGAAEKKLAYINA
jgi:hypothetical protein